MIENQKQGFFKNLNKKLHKKSLDHRERIERTREILTQLRLVDDSMAEIAAVLKRNLDVSEIVQISEQIEAGNKIIQEQLKLNDKLLKYLRKLTCEISKEEEEETPCVIPSNSREIETISE